MPETQVKTGAARDTLSKLVDEYDPSKELKIGKQLGLELREALVSFLRNNLGVFAWDHSDMIDPDVMYHNLNVDPNRKGATFLQEEVDRLLKAGLVKEAFYPTWLDNPVLVRKPNGKWRTFIYFTNLNKACLRDSFPLPRIDQLVDSNAGMSY